jgi:hypothetical protein
MQPTIPTIPTIVIMQPTTVRQLRVMIVARAEKSRMTRPRVLESTRMIIRAIQPRVMERMVVMMRARVMMKATQLRVTARVGVIARIIQTRVMMRTMQPACYPSKAVF